MAYLERLTYSERRDLKKGQRRMTFMLKEFDRICRKHKLKYWCMGGTLVGVLRSKGWVPYDNDVDVGMIDTDYKVLQKIAQKELPKNMWFQDSTTDEHYKQKIGKIRDLYSNYKDYTYQNHHNGLQLDIFIFEQTTDNKLVPTWPYKHEPESVIYDLHESSLIFDLKEMKFENLKVFVPNKYELYSQEAWGAYPPPVLPDSKQYPHEGRTELRAPEWMIKKYPKLYRQ